MIRVFTSAYLESNEARAAELEECLRRNLDHADIDSVNLFVEEPHRLVVDHPKLFVRPISHRPTYLDFFEWANELVTSRSDTSVIANSDIYFDSSLSALANNLTARTCVALTRWDVQPDASVELFYRNDSQDTWVFKGSIRDLRCDFPVGVPRCDNRILYELRRVNYLVLNPSFSIRSFHLHAGEREDYCHETLSSFVDPPYNYLWPHNLLSLPATVVANLLHPHHRVGWRLDRRLLATSFPARAIRRILRTFESVSDPSHVD